MIRTLYILSFFLGTSGFGACRDIYRVAYPHPIRSLIHLAHLGNPFSIPQHWNSLGSRVEAGEHPQIIDGARLGDGMLLLTDARGRDFVVHETDSTYQSHAFDKTGKLVARGNEEKPFTPSDRAYGPGKFTATANELAGLALRGKSLAKVVSKLDASLLSALEMGVEFALPAAPGFPKGVKGYVTREPLSENLIVHVVTPEKEVTIYNQLGDRQRVHAQAWAEAMGNTTVPLRETPDESDTEKSRKIFRSVERNDLNAAALADTLKFPIKTMFYPHAIPYKIMRHWITERTFMGKPILNVVGRTILRDSVAVSGFMFLILSGGHPVTIFVEIAAEDEEKLKELRKEMMLARDFLIVTDKDVHKGNGLTMMVDGISPSDTLHGSPEYLFDTRIKSGTSAYSKTLTVKQMVQNILAATKASGKKLDHLEIFGHGDTVFRTASLLIGDELLTKEPEKLKAELADTLKMVKEYYRKENLPLPPEVERLERFKVVGFDALEPLKDQFNPGASVRLLSCNIGMQQPGTDFLQEIGMSTVAKDGGVVVGATVSLAIIPSDYPREVRDAITKQMEKENQLEQEPEQEKPEKRTFLGEAAVKFEILAKLPYYFFKYGNYVVRREPVVAEPIIKVIEFSYETNDLPSPP